VEAEALTAHGGTTGRPRPLLRRVCKPSSPPSSDHPILAAVARADAAPAALSGRSSRRPSRGDGDPTPARLGESTGAGLRRRCHGLLQVRRSDEDPRGRHRSRRHRQAPVRVMKPAHRRDPVFMDSCGCSDKCAPRRRARLRASSRRRRVPRPGKGGELAYECILQTC